MLRRSPFVALASLLLIFSLLSADPPSKSELEKQVTLTQYQERRDLREGKMPPFLSEAIRMVPTELEESKLFDAQMQKLIRRLFPDHDFNSEPVKFVMVSEEGLPACGVLKAVPAKVIGVGLQQLREAKSLDEIAFFIGHEFAHLKFRQRYGAELRNSKGEEMTADLLAIYQMMAAGLNPEAGLRMAKKNLVKKKPEWIDIIEVHPLDSNRIRLIQDELSYLAVKRTFPDKEIPISTALAEAFTSAKHVSFVDKHLPEAEWNKASLPRS